MPNHYLGFYWTLPVNWAGFRHLPANVDDAAAASRTIRYQRERVRQFVAEDKGVLRDEIAFIDVQPDRTTDLIQAELRTRAATYAGRATLLYISFEDVSHWRRNTHLLAGARELGLEVLPLQPDPVLIDGEIFNPVLHFKQWRKQDKSARTRLKLDANEGLRLALAEVPEKNGRWQVIAERLNHTEVRTSNGGLWTAENVRKHVSRL